MGAVERMRASAHGKRKRMDTGGGAADDDNDSGASLGRGVVEGDDEVEHVDVDLEEMREAWRRASAHAPSSYAAAAPLTSYMLPTES